MKSQVAPGDDISTSRPEEVQPELPEWRLELSRRLQEIRAKRDVAEANPTESEAVSATAGASAGAGTAPDTEEPDYEQPKPPPVKPVTPRRPRRIPRVEYREAKSGADAPRQAQATPASEAPPESRVSEQVHPAPVREPAADILIRNTGANSPAASERNVQDLIDAVKTRHLAEVRTPAPSEEFQAPILVSGDSRSKERMEPQYEKLILLTRTLAGLVDLILVTVCAGSLVFAVDVLEGITVFDSVSVMYYSMLLLAVYLVYSLFFLSTARQTIGMMLTDLRLVGVPVGPPSAMQLVARCVLFLVGLAAAGAGLLWGCFDPKARCLHDLVSGTRVERIAL